MAEMFGSPVGARLWNEDWRGNVQTGVNAANVLSQIASRPGEDALRKAQTEKIQSDLRVNEEQRRLMQVAAQAANQSGATDILGRFDAAAETLAAAGQFTEANKLAETASQIRSRQATAASQRVQAQLNALKTEAQVAENMAQFFGGANSQAELDAANDRYAFMTGKPSPMQGQMWSPALTQSLNQQALTAKERAELEEKRLTREATEEYRDTRLEQFDVENRIRQAAQRVREEREARLRKQGGPQARLPSAEPKLNEIRQVKNLLYRDIPWLAESTDSATGSAVNDAAFTIAAEARAKMRANPALSLSAAINQAYTESQGDIQAQTGAFGGRRFGASFKFTGGGRSPETALPVQRGMKPEQLKQGRYYVNQAGQIARWDGKEMQPVQARSNRGALPDRNTDGDDEE